MQAFVRVVEHGAFGRAADDLGISRASITEAIRQLEKQVGVRLLNRTTRRLSLTDEGRSYYEDCVRVLDQVAEAEDRLTGNRLVPRGRLRVSVPQSFGDTIFYPALKAFMERFPELTVELVITDRAVNLVEEGIDCAMRGVAVPPDSGLVARKLSNTSWLTCASPAYLEANGTPETIEDLAHHECIRFVSPSTAKEVDWVFADNGKQTSITPFGRLRVTSLGGALAAAIGGLGVVQVSDAVAYQSLVDGQLEVVLTDVIAPAAPLMLVYPGNRYLPARVRAFRDFFAGVFPPEGWWSRVAGHRDPKPGGPPGRQ